MKCCICGNEIEGHGHNPWPYIKDKDVKCCDNCNAKVLEERVRRYGIMIPPKGESNELHNA